MKSPKEPDSTEEITIKDKSEETETNPVRGFIVPHIRESSFGSCQDSLYANPEHCFFTVVDGVSEGMGQFHYVNILSKYNHNTDDIRLSKEDAEKIHHTWKAIQEILIANGRMGKMMRRRYDAGIYAHSTYIRMKFYDGENEGDNIRWKCAVLGDSAMLHIRQTSEGLKIKHVMMSNDKIRLDKYIYSDSDKYYDFSAAPDQLDEEGTWQSNEAFMENENCERGDIFILATDHVSEWILQDASLSIERITQLLSIQTQDEYLKLMDKEREEGKLGDDDETAMIIEITDPKKLEFTVHSIIDPYKKYYEEKRKVQYNLEADNLTEEGKDRS